MSGRSRTASGGWASARPPFSRRNSLPILGAILAGGRSSRFGSDKALALHQGRPLIAHVEAAMQAQCADIAVCGRDWGDYAGLADHPGPGLGPMAGLCAALRHASNSGFDAVLAAPCDLLGIPADAYIRLSPGPAVADQQWLLGLWPCAGAASLEHLLRTEGAISALRWIEVSGAAIVSIPFLQNVNRPSDLG